MTFLKILKVEDIGNGYVTMLKHIEIIGSLSSMT